MRAMSASIDLRKAHLSRVHGDITAVLSWLNDERALFLIPHLRNGAPWYIVLESSAFSWDDSVPSNVGNVARKAMKACEVLGIEPTPTNCRRIAGLIIDSLPDLITMPSAPPKEHYKASYGNLVLRADGQAMAGEEIKLEKQGATYG